MFTGAEPPSTEPVANITVVPAAFQGQTVDANLYSTIQDAERPAPHRLGGQDIEMVEGEDADGDGESEVEETEEAVPADAVTGLGTDQELYASGRPKRKASSSAIDRPKGPIKTRKRLKTSQKQAIDKEESEDEESDGDNARQDYVSDSDGEDELDSDAEPSQRPHARRSRSSTNGKKAIRTVRDLPTYAQNAYAATAFGYPKLPMPMVLLPGLRSRKPPPIPIPELTKKSRGRHVSTNDDDMRKYCCIVAGCDK